MKTSPVLVEVETVKTSPSDTAVSRQVMDHSNNSTDCSQCCLVTLLLHWHSGKLTAIKQFVKCFNIYKRQ